MTLGPALAQTCLALGECKDDIDGKPVAIVKQMILESKSSVPDMDR